MTTLNTAQIAQIVAATLAAMNGQPKTASKKPRAAITPVDGKTERQLKSERATIVAFKKAGYGKVTPRVDVKTYNLWLAEGFKVKTGEKSLKVGPFRLFHEKQVEYVGHSAKPEGLSDADIAEFRQANGEATGEAVSS